MGSDPTFLREPPADDGARRAYDADRTDDGYVWNFTRLWSWRPDFSSAFQETRGGLISASTLSERECAVLVTTTAAAREDAYCSLAWGTRLAGLTDPETAAEVIGSGRAERLTERENALAEWARQIVSDPNATTPADVEHLRKAGIGDREIFEATAIIALRVAFCTVNDALGAGPDKQLADAAPEAVRAAVAFGRPAGTTPSTP